MSMLKGVAAKLGDCKAGNVIVIDKRHAIVAREIGGGTQLPSWRAVIYCDNWEISNWWATTEVEVLSRSIQYMENQFVEQLGDYSEREDNEP